MASIKQRGNAFLVSVSLGRDTSGKQIIKSATFRPDPEQHRTKRQIEKALNEFAVDFERKVKSGNTADGDKVKFRDFITEDYLPNYAKSRMTPSSYERTESTFRVIVLRHIGNLRLSQIKPKHLEKLYNDMLKGIEISIKEKTVTRKYSFGTIKRVHRSISGALSYALKNDIILQNPCSKADLPIDYNVKKEIKCFTIDEAKEFMNYLDEPYTIVSGGKSNIVQRFDSVPLQLKTAFSIAISCGARKGEILALTWDDINFRKKVMTISKSASFTSEGRITKIPKSLHSIRDVPLPDECIALLKKWRTQQLKLKVQFRHYWNDDNNLIFVQEQTGNPMSNTTLYNAFKYIIKRYNADETHKAKLPDIKLHGLRHTAGSIMIANGIPVPTVSNILGHSDTVTTMRIYVHEIKDYDEAVRNAMSKSIFAKA